MQKRIRDIELLDALDKLERVAVNTNVWRSVHSEKNALLGSASGGRWEPGYFDVLYTSFEPEGSVAELYFQLGRQPVFPSTKVKFSLHEISVETTQTLKFADLSALKPFGINERSYKKIMYERTKEIGEATHFLGFDGIIAPSARWPCLNMIIFTDRIGTKAINLVNTTEIDWNDWQRRLAQ